MKLTEDERLVISNMYFHADKPLREVAQETGLREHVARRCLEKLLERKVINYRAFVNPYAAGLCEYMVLIGTQNMSPAARQLLLTTLLESPHTTYVGTVGGDYHLAVMVVAEKLQDIPLFIESLSAGVQGAAFEISLATCVSVTLYRPKFLGSGGFGSESVSYGPTSSVATLDTLDHKILHALGSSASSSHAQLGKALGVPTSTVTYRTQSLREKGVLVGIGLSVLPFNDGYFAFAFQVCAGSMPSDVQKKFREYCLKHPSISFLIEAIGGWNFQVGARLEDSRGATVLADDIQQRFAPYVLRVSVIPIHEARKLFPHPLMVAWARSQNHKVA